MAALRVHKMVERRVEMVERRVDWMAAEMAVMRVV